MVDGAAYKDEVEARNIMAVPTIYLNGEFWRSMSVEEILEKLNLSPNISEFENKDPYDVLIVGGGPAGASAAVYTARKGIRTGIITDRFGGQVKETLGIENFIGLKYIEGPKLAASLEEHVRSYDVDLLYPQRVKGIEKKELIEVELEMVRLLKAKQLLLPPVPDGEM